MIAVHGGAGGGGDAQVEGVRAALLAGAVVLDAGGPALDAACAAVAVLEADGRFNAGRGAVRTYDGGIELDAAVMTGHDRAAGAVAAVTNAAHPVRVARAVLDAGRAVLLAGPGADAFVVEKDLELAAADWFVTEANSSPAGTVGAVALDRSGKFAAATSTGGMRRQRWGRVGDTPVIGAGTYADASCAVSATGDGEAFIRAVFAHSIAVAVGAGATLADACAAALDDVTAFGGTGGCVAIGGDGQVVLDHNTAVMPAGWATSAADLHVQLAKP
ncbi:MAG TPA: isoaspartyl peptidase/L-asparaginase [Acidimicrobiales bacterium]|nr:isoaspartyl peptidase/L-asparaginase [Acidimicrobiales bacterium]